MTDKEEDSNTISIEVAQEPATRILGFAPLQLSDDIYNVVNDNLGRMIDDFGEKLLERYQTKLDPSRVEKLLNVCKYKLQLQQDYLFDEFDKYLVGDLLSVDPNVVLEEDRCQLTYSEKKAHLVEARIDTYTKRLVTLNACSTLLDQKSAELKCIEKHLASFNKLLSDTIQTSFGVDSIDDLCLLVLERTRSLMRLCSEFRDAFDT
ncbi:hypothetical protein X801_06217, partial [Opisthorchis viverrini]|uniref:Protein MIS12 homolog n=2 Tax=Opisthorchis viverrini TaxID=6198 RepID=A0A074ZPN1_OPIVI